MFYNDVVKITRCNKLHLLSDLVKCISAKLLEASKFADQLPIQLGKFCQPDFSLMQRPAGDECRTFASMQNFLRRSLRIDNKCTKSISLYLPIVVRHYSFKTSE